MRLLGASVDSTWDVSQEDRATVMTYLMVKINLSNSHRTGVFCNMQLTEVALARKDEESGRFVIMVRKYNGEDKTSKCVTLTCSHISYLCMYCYVNFFQVKQHKTASTFSATGVTLTPTIMTMLNHYITHLRTDTSSPYVFVTGNGAQFTTSRVAYCFRRAFAETDYKGHLSCTKIRKSTVTKVS